MDGDNADLDFIDELCATTHDLSTMSAAVDRTPELAVVPISPVRWRTDTLGRYTSEKGVLINLTPEPKETMSHRFDVQLTTLPHELRHGFQHVMGCSVYDDARLNFHLDNLIRCDRVFEADATAFSLVMMYDLFLEQDNPQPLHVAGKVHPDSVEAYWHETSLDPDTHWNGKAAMAAFEAYFYPRNESRLTDYDMRLCRKFLRAAKQKDPRDYEPVSEQERRDIFEDYMNPLASLPFTDNAGRTVEREFYRPQDCNLVMAPMSRAVRRAIHRANETLGLG